MSRNRYTTPTRYYVSMSHDMDHFVEMTVTIDEAFYLASKKTTKGSVIKWVVWNLDAGKRHVRAIAENGSCVWARVCSQCNGDGTVEGKYCYTCGMLGAIT